MTVRKKTIVCKQNHFYDMSFI